MLVIGRVTKDAVVSKLKDNREVVNFAIALNDWYKPKGQEQGITVTTFINCSYWLSTKIAERITKGALVEINGRLYANAYMSASNEPKASVNCHVNTIKIHQSTKSDLKKEKHENKKVVKEEVADDLPF